MNRLKTLVCLLIGGVALVSCDKINNDISEGETKLEIVSTINTLRVENDKWQSGDQVGVFALNAGQTIPEGFYDGKANVKYSVETNGVFAETGTSIIFPKNGAALDFVAYYPYQEGITNGIYNVNVVDQTNLSKLDLIYSNDAKGKTKANPRVNLAFNHQLALFDMTIRVVPGADISLDGATARFENILTTATFNLASGTLTPGTESAPMTLSVHKVSENEARISMILIPGTSLEESSLKVTLGGKEYTWKPETMLIEAGKKYVVTTSVGTVEGEITTIFGSSISDWNVENIDGGTLTPKDDSSAPGESPEDPEQGGGSGEPDNGNGGNDAPEAPSPSPAQGELLFEGADFENEAALKALLLDKFPLSEYITFVEGGRTGKALKVKTTQITKNAFIFNIQSRDKSFSGKKKIVFYIKGTSKKSLSINVYTTGTDKNVAKIFNVGNVSADKTLSVTGKNLYEGTINTQDQWVKIELNIADFADSIAKSGDLFGIKIGDKVPYDLLIDDITVE